MRNFFIKFNCCIVIVLAAASLPLLVSGTAAAQTIRGSTPDLDRRREAEKTLRDNERLRRGMDADIEARARTKEERQAVVNEAFMRLQVLHNEMMTIVLSSDAPDSRVVTAAVAETKKRAIELRANLVLPKLPKDEKEKKTDDVADDGKVKESLALLCSLIKSFVTNLNNSPTDNKAGEQARRELDSLVTLSDKITRNLVEAGKRVN